MKITSKYVGNAKREIEVSRSIPHGKDLDLAINNHFQAMGINSYQFVGNIIRGNKLVLTYKITYQL